MRRALLLIALAACRGEPAVPDARPDGDGFPYPPPRTDVVAPLGGPDTLELAAWNIENFPGSSVTPSRVADLITSLDLDIVVVEEIASETAWRELLERLREHDGILSEHRYTPTEYQKIGIIYRTSLVTPSNVGLIFTSDAYVFPRPPFVADLAIDDGIHRPLSLYAIGVHLKAGVDDEDYERRRVAFVELDRHVRAKLAAGTETEIVIAGDYNEVLDTAVGQASFAPLLAAPDLYTVHTQAASDAGEISFVPASVLLDHITTTADLADELTGARLVIPRLHVLPRYVAEVSDHLPVVLVTPLVPR